MAQTQDNWSNFFTTDFSNPTAFQDRLSQMAAQYSAPKRSAPAPMKSTTSALSTATPPGTAPTTPTTPAAPPTPAARPAAPAAPTSTGGSRFDRLREGAKMQYETELAALKEREAQGFQVPPLSYKRVGERYRNAIRGIDAEESMETRRNEGKRLRAERAAAPKPAPKPAPAPAAPTTTASTSDASYTSVEDIRARGQGEQARRNAEAEAAALRAKQATQPTPDVKGLVANTPQAAVDNLATPPSPYTHLYDRPQDVGPPVPQPSTQDILAALDPRVKKRFAEANADPTSPLGYALRTGDKDARNQMIIALSRMSPDEQLAALSAMETQSSDRIYTDPKMNQELSAANAKKSMADREASLAPEYRAERDRLYREYELRGVDWGSANQAIMDKFEFDLNRRLAQKYPSKFGSTISPVREPQTFAEHLSKGVQDLNQRSPGDMRLGTQLESAAGLIGAVGPLAPVGAGIATAGAVGQTLASDNIDDDLALQGLTNLALRGKAGQVARGVIRDARIDQSIARERDRLVRDYNIPEPPPPAQLPGPPTTAGQLPPGGPIITPPPPPPAPPKALPPGSITDDALSEVAATPRPAPNPANASPASKSNIAERARASDPAVAARDAAATKSPGTGIPVKAPEEQGLLPGFRRSTAPEGAKNQNVVREFQTGQNSPTFQVVTDPESGRTGAFTVLENPGEGARPVVFVNINGETVPFWRSQGGTGGKVAGEWYPFQGTDLEGWLIKADMKNLKSGYNIPEVKQAQQYLNQTFKAATPDEAIGQMRRFFNNPIADEANGASALINRGAMQQGLAGAESAVPRGVANRRAMMSPKATPEARQAASENYRRYMRDRIGAMRGDKPVSTPEMAPQAQKDLPGQMNLGTVYEGAAAERQAQEAKFHNFVQDVMDGFFRGG